MNWLRDAVIGFVAVVALAFTAGAIVVGSFFFFASAMMLWAIVISLYLSRK